MPTKPERRPALLLIGALDHPLALHDRAEIARRLREHERLLRDVLLELRERLARAEGRKA